MSRASQYFPSTETGLFPKYRNKNKEKDKETKPIKKQILKTKKHQTTYSLIKTTKCQRHSLRRSPLPWL